MAPVFGTGCGALFLGNIDAGADVSAAARAAAVCDAFARDEDDECYVEGDCPSCFNCRGRRWVQGGFSCMRGLLNG